MSEQRNRKASESVAGMEIPIESKEEKEYRVHE